MVKSIGRAQASIPAPTGPGCAKVQFLRLSLATLDRAPALCRPAYDPARLAIGMAHLGLGAFHRAHQAVFTDAAVAEAGGDWGVLAVSMRKPDVARSLAPQDGLYTVERLDGVPTYQIVGSIRAVATLPLEPETVLAAVGAPGVHVVTLTITEKGYCLDGQALDWTHPDIVHDLNAQETPRSAIGVLVRGLARRRPASAPLTVISCDNLAENGPRLGAAVLAFADRVDARLARWIEDNAAFPETMVDSIVPASTPESRRRVDMAIGLEDEASVQREPFAEWVVENRFAGPRPAWDKVGVEMVDSVAAARRLKLHVLNAAHSALAYLGLAAGHLYVRDAIADPAIASFLDRMVAEEIAPALPDLDAGRYWVRTKARFANPMIDHRLDQIAQDGAFKLEQRIAPLVAANLRAGRPSGSLIAVIRAWMAFARLSAAEASAVLTADPAVRAAIFGAG